MEELLLFPAYGKVYRTQEELQIAWDSNKDFTPHYFGGGAYISKNDGISLSWVKDTGYTHLVLVGSNCVSAPKLRLALADEVIY